MTWLIVLVDMHVVRLLVPVDVATHVSDLIVVTESGNELTLCEIEVDKESEVVVPNNVAVGEALHDIWRRAVLQGHNVVRKVSLDGEKAVRKVGTRTGTRYELFRVSSGEVSNVVRFHLGFGRLV